MSKEFPRPRTPPGPTIDCEMDDGSANAIALGTVLPTSACRFSATHTEVTWPVWRLQSPSRNHTPHPLGVMNPRILRGTMGPVCRTVGPGPTTAMLAFDRSSSATCSTLPQRALRQIPEIPFSAERGNCSNLAKDLLRMSPSTRVLSARLSHTFQVRWRSGQTSTCRCHS